MTERDSDYEVSSDHQQGGPRSVAPIPIATVRTALLVSIPTT
jgi:hypothetical protein